MPEETYEELLEKVKSLDKINMQEYLKTEIMMNLNTNKINEKEFDRLILKQSDSNIKGVLTSILEDSKNNYTPRKPMRQNCLEYSLINIGLLPEMDNDVTITKRKFRMFINTIK